MTQKFLNIAAIIPGLLLVTSISFGRVQLFERGENGLVIPIAGVVASPEVVAWNAGFEYTIESRSSIGLYVSQPVKDTSFDAESGYKSLSIYPIASFEIFEPDREFPLSASLNLKYEFHSGSKEDANGTTIMSSREAFYSGGPEIGGRFYIGEVGLIAPAVGYDFIYFRKNIRAATEIQTTNGRRTVAGAPDVSDGFLHDANIEVIFGYMFNEIWGISADPKFSMRFGGEKTVEFFGGLTIGLQIKFQ